jgi:hypothetical protein
VDHPLQQIEQHGRSQAFFGATVAILFVTVALAFIAFYFYRVNTVQPTPHPDDAAYNAPLADLRYP